MRVRWRDVRTIRSRSWSVASAGPFTATFVVASNLSVGSGVIVSFFSLAHLTASARFRARAPGPVSGRLSGPSAWRRRPSRPGFPLPFRLPAFASRSSYSRRGVGPSSRSAYRTRHAARTPTGLPRSARMSCDRGGCPLYPEDGGAPPGQVVSLTGACRSAAASPSTPLQHPIAGLRYEASTRVQAIHPSGLPLARGRPDGTGRRFGFPPSFAPRRPGADDARRGGDRPSSTDLELRAQHHIGRSSNR